MKPLVEFDRHSIVHVETRLFDLTPSTYDAKTRTVQAILSKGSPVQRFYGTEKLQITSTAVDLNRIYTAGVPLLDSHKQDGINNALGRATSAWIDGGALMGAITFNETPEARKAEGMVERGEITGISIGYRVADWKITDADGDVVDPEIDQHRWSDDKLTFTAIRWELLEISLCSVPADAAAGILRSNVDRALPSTTIRDARARMLARQRMHDRHQAMLQGLRA